MINTSRLNTRRLFLILTVILSVFLLSYFVDYQPYISQGDHGRDLYAFAETAGGAAVPYRDYWWVYGPVMPYYYALFVKLFGVAVPSVLLGKMVLVGTAGIFIYLTLSLITAPVFAFLGSLWFYLYHQDFFYTYNHMGAVAVLMIIMHQIVGYIRTRNLRHVKTALIFCFLLCLIKINFGFCALLAAVVVTWLVDRHHHISHKTRLGIYAAALAGIPALSILIHAIFVGGLPVYVIKQCFPYLGADHPYHASVFESVKALVVQNCKIITDQQFRPLVPGVIFLLSSVVLAIRRKNLRVEPDLSIVIFSAATFVLMYVLNLHEFLVSAVFYRSFWSEPFRILLMFLVIGTAARFLSKPARAAVIAILLIWTIVPVIRMPFTENRVKPPERYLPLERARVYVKNGPEWIKTVVRTTQILNANLKDDELFFAVPNDPLYYYLTGRQSPVQLLIFHDHINIPPEQERTIIEHLESKDVDWVVLSSRFHSDETGLGTLGETYCPLIGKYIQENFEPVARFGNWSEPSGWAVPHGTMVLKRK